MTITQAKYNILDEKKKSIQTISLYTLLTRSTLPKSVQNVSREMPVGSEHTAISFR